MSSSSSFILKKQVHFKEGEQYWLLPTPYHPTKIKSGTVCCKEKEDDEGMTHSDTTIDYKVSSFQINLSSEFENRLLPNDLIIVRNHGDDEEDIGEEFGGVVDELEAQSKSSSSLLRSPGVARTKINAQAAYGVRFGCSLYGWKDNFKELPMELV